MRFSPRTNIFILMSMVIAFTITGFSTNTLAQPKAKGGDAGNATCKKIAADPTWKKWSTGSTKRIGTFCHPDSFRHTHPPRGTIFEQVAQKCSVDMHQCKWGWDAFAGKPDPKLGPYFMANLEFAKWGGRRNNAGSYYVFKLTNYQTHTLNAQRAAIGLALFPQAGAAAAVAKTISSKQLQSNLWACKSDWPYRALWLLGAKAQLGTILKGLTWRTVGGRRNRPCQRAHVSEMLPRLASWTLTPAQKKVVEDLCASSVFPDAKNDGKQACLRYLGRIATKHADAREHIANIARGRTSHLVTEAIRTAGQAGIKDL